MYKSVNFPGWEVVRKIGEGSFDGVYEIQRKLPDGRVETAALKKMSIPRDQEEVYVLQSQSFSGEQITAYFKKQMEELVREYLFMQKLSGCPNVVSCQDVRYSPHEDGIGWDIYIRMELLTPLKKYVTGQYSEYQVLRLGLDMCRALAACEKQNIIHRDIKPQNILVSENRTYKLADFGIAKVSEKTESGTMAGTNGYIAPEVANRQKYGKEVDIYSLGMVLYWLMNDNTLPFLPLPPQIPTAEQRDLAAQQRLDGVPLPPPVNGSAALKSVVCKACAFDPAARYRSAVEFGSALLKLYWQQKPVDSDDILQEIGLTRDMLNGEPGTILNKTYKKTEVHAPAEPAETEAPPVKKEKRLVPVIAGVIAAVLCAGAGFLYMKKQPLPQPEPVQTETAAVTQAETQPPTTVPETEPPIWEYTVGAAGVTFTRWLDASAAEAVIPDTLEDVPVTEIGANAFAGCTGLTSVQFPESVEKIGDQAFAGCENLSGVLFPDNLVQIGAAAFQDCKALTEIDIPEGMQSVGDGAFSGSGLLSATVPAKFQSSADSFLPEGCEITWFAFEKPEISGEPGDTFFFGRYEQDGDLSNGEEPIEWLILEKNDNQYLVISKYGLDSQKYHDQWEVVTWETCRLRVWLNQTFYGAAFNPAEQDMIMTSDVCSESPTHSYPSRTVQDKIFLLDCRESYRYFKSEKARTCIATQYAIDQGSTVQYGGTCWWWLREGYFVDLASIPNLQRANFTDSGGTVRPVMWIDAG